MTRTNKETVKAHLNLLMGHLLGDWDGNKKVINSIQYAIRAVDAFNPNGIPLKKRVFRPQEQEKTQV